MGAAIKSLKHSRDKSHNQQANVFSACDSQLLRSGNTQHRVRLLVSASRGVLMPSFPPRCPPPALSNAGVRDGVRKGTEPFNSAAHGKAYD